MSDPNREEQGKQLNAAEQAERQRMAQGIIKPRFTEEQNRLIKEGVDIGAMARQIATTRVSIKQFDANGQLIDSQPQPLGHEELYLMWLGQRFARGENR